MDLDQKTIPVTDWWPYAHSHRLRNRLAVVATDAAGVIQHAGGWLCDRVMAGWDVTVALADTGHSDPLRILGVTVMELEGPLAVPVHQAWPQSLLVAPQLCDSDERVRRGVRDCRDHPSVELALWDDGRAREFDDALTPTTYRISAAGTAFKTCALVAARRTADPPDRFEYFRTLKRAGTADRVRGSRIARP